MLLSPQQLPSPSSLQCWGARRRKRRRRRRGARTQDIQAIGEVTIGDLDTTATVTEDDHTSFVGEVTTKDLIEFPGMNTE